jgi:hypothetical protein
MAARTMARADSKEADPSSDAPSNEEASRTAAQCASWEVALTGDTSQHL